MQTNEECLKKFKEENSFRLNERTSYAYLKDVRNLLAHCEKSFADVTSKDIRCWMQNLESHYKPTSIRKMVTGVRSFFSYCLEEEFITQNPLNSIKALELDDKIPHYLQNEQLTELRELVKGRVQERAIVEVLYTTGVRVSELRELKREDIVWMERIIHIRNGKGKKDRIVLFTRTCEEHLKACLNKRQDNLPFVFLNVAGTGPICVRYIERKFVTYKIKLGIHLTPHTLRHTFAAHLAMKGMPLVGIQSLLGHVEPKHTQLYARLCNHTQKEMYDLWM